MLRGIADGMRLSTPRQWTDEEFEAKVKEYMERGLDRETAREVVLVGFVNPTGDVIVEDPSDDGTADEYAEPETVKD